MPRREPLQISTLAPQATKRPSLLGPSKMDKSVTSPCPRTRSAQHEQARLSKAGHTWGHRLGGPPQSPSLLRRWHSTGQHGWLSTRQLQKFYCS
eukprot:242149-Pyramimonas_sp.AAC.1